VTPKKLAFISFEPIGDQFMPYIAAEKVFDADGEPNILMQRALRVYINAIRKMTAKANEIESCRNNRKPVSARLVWSLGDLIFLLRNDLEKLGLQLDGVYDHVARDLRVKKKWLEKIIILRRYLPDRSLIPQTISWGRLEKGTKKKALLLSSGKQIS